MEEKKHKRRVRYSGKYPKSFKEKYKEHNPDKYGDTIERVIQKGSTPAGMHISIMVSEIKEFLKISPGDNGLDATLGYGGHSTEMLKCLEGKGHLTSLDIDPVELPKTRKRLLDRGFDEDIVTCMELNFSNIDELGESKFDFVLADLGVSSMQIDDPDRGFSYKTEGPLDLRMNPTKGIPASDRLLGLSQLELEGMLVENADEPFAEEISTAVMDKIYRGNYIKTTSELRAIITEALDFLPKHEKKATIKKSCQRCFQALRIDVNQEFESLYNFLEKLPGVLAPGGRVAILSFHSGEDRLVKKSFKYLKSIGVYSDIAPSIIRPSAEECHLNPRAKSTKMRWAIRNND